MKTALVWGASGGIGRALVQALREDAWTVIAVSRHPDDLSALTPHTLQADVVDPQAVAQAVAATGRIAAKIDLSIYAAGDITSRKIEELEPATWRRILDANLTGVYLTTHLSLPLLSPTAHLVFLGAVSERLQLPGLAAYATAKAGLEAFVTVLRKEQRKRRITLVRPAAVATPLWDKVPFRMPKHAPPPETIARHILAAYREGHTGTLDL